MYTWVTETTFKNTQLQALLKPETPGTLNLKLKFATPLTVPSLDPQQTTDGAPPTSRCLHASGGSEEGCSESLYHLAV